MPEEEDFSPIETLRAVAATATPPDTTEFGLDQRALPVKSSDDAPLSVRLRGTLLGQTATPAGVLADILLLEANLPTDEWRRFRMAAGRALGFVAHRGDQDDVE